MNEIAEKHRLGRSLPGRNMLKPVHFNCHAPQARSVSLIGDFNGWNPTAHPMRRQLDGPWYAEVGLPHGHHQYLFMIDGQPTPDTHAMGSVRNQRNEIVSLVAVS
jgi:1,4-alpha-glucan branching enzyme